MSKFIVIILTLVYILSCDQKIEITDEYIYNSEWNSKNNHPAVSIKRIKVDGINLENLDKISGFDILHNYTIDSSFCYITKINRENYKKIFFDKVNPNIVWINEFEINNRLDKIGKLEINNWYLFDSYLKPNYLYFVFIDEEKSSHVWIVSPVNI